MTRVIFLKGKQSVWINTLLSQQNTSIIKLAQICKVSQRTIRDWRREKYTISERALLHLSNYYAILIPPDTTLVSDYWYAIKGARKGGLRRFELYGPIGTTEGRKKGGKASQLRRKENPEKYRLLGCNVRKKFKIKGPSIKLAEAAGIILGDGGITNYQLRITVSSLVDIDYAIFIRNLFEKVFGEKPSWRKCSCCNSIDLTISGANLIEELEKWGFVRGDKTRQQVDFPSWIWKRLDYQKACVRGLMDTDGGCYFHRHKTQGLFYRNFGMCFTNRSIPIIKSVKKVLKLHKLKFSIANKGTQIYIYDFEEIKKYFNVIGSHNPKNIKKFQEYLHEKTHRIIA